MSHSGGELPAKNVNPGRRNGLPRVPLRDRSIERFNALIAATERLLEASGPDDIGLYQIAREAGVPAASVYHFFPNKEAAFFALAQHYIQAFREIRFKPVDAAALVSWQDLARIEQRRAMELYNAHPAAMRTFYGGWANSDIRQADVRYTESAAREAHSRFDAVFDLPPVPDTAKKFQVAIAIVDAVWGLSYLKHGEITEAYFDEGFDAFVAYCRLFLPVRTELREEHRAAVREGRASMVSFPG